MDIKERKHFELHIFPYIINCVVISEQLVFKYRSLQSLREQRSHTLIPYDLVASIIASSLLCLLPLNPLSNQWLSDVNFTYVLLNILNSRTSELRLRCVISYLDYCRSSKLLSLKGLVISHRVWSHSDLSKYISTEFVTSHDLKSTCGRLMNVLSSTHLPCLFVDNTLTSDQMVLKTHLPMVHFMGSRVGGELLSGGISQTECLFSKYPDLISVIPLCPRLGYGETLWVDHVRGPFLPQALSLSAQTGYPSEKGVNWRRFILLSGNRYPAWMSEVQYSTQCLVREIILVASGLFPNELKYNTDLIRPGLLSRLWWDYLTSKPGVQSPYTANKLIQPFNSSIYPCNNDIKVIKTGAINNMLQFADKFVCGMMNDIQNTIKMMQINKSPHRNVNKHDSLSPRSQTTSEYRLSVQPTLNVANSMLNISKTDNKLCNNVDRSMTNCFDSRNAITSNRLPQTNCIEHPKINQPIISSHYADDLVEESVKYAQQLSSLHNHHLYTYVDKLIDNAFQNASKLMNWSNQLSKQILNEVQYSHVVHNHNEFNTMHSMINDMDNEFNKTNSNTDTTNDRLHEDDRVSEKSAQHQINQQDSFFEFDEKYSIENQTESQSHQIPTKCSSPELCQISSTKLNNSLSIKDTNDLYMKTHLTNNPENCMNSENLSIQSDSIMNDLPRIFISEKLSEFSNSIAVQCLISAFGEIYIRKMSSHLNHNPPMNTTSDFIINDDKDQDSSELNQYNHSNIRPPGLILDCGLEKYPSNYYADPQLRILIQWISATLVYNSPCSKFSYLDNKMKSLSDNNNTCDNDILNNELKDFKDEISMEHSCSPLVCCTNGNSELKELQTIVSLVHKASWTAKDLFCAILDYFHYRSEHLKLSTTATNDDNNFIQSQKDNNRNYCAIGFDFRNLSISNEKSKQTLLSLFDYLIQQFHIVK
ncbi:unnamed protein product [Schistosoma turkestanicum]|nr:unnamed protein product [Schistosoma turkestanicum]